MTTPAGWYPDPAGSVRRRYWDGQQWTDHYTDPVIVTPPRKPTAPAAFLLCGIFGWAMLAADERVGSVGASVTVVVVLFGIWLAFRVDRRRKWRQRIRDRNAGLAINCDVEDEAYTRGDDERGMHGQYPPAL